MQFPGLKAKNIEKRTKFHKCILQSNELMYPRWQTFKHKSSRNSYNLSMFCEAIDIYVKYSTITDMKIRGLTGSKSKCFCSTIVFSYFLLDIIPYENKILFLLMKEEAMQFEWQRERFYNFKIYIKSLI